MSGSMYNLPEIPLGLSFDDVLIVPQYSDLASRSLVSTKSWLCRDIHLEVPIISSNMDTVTMSEMAIAMAKLGGIGFVHRFLSVEVEAREIEKVKRYRSHIINDPYTIHLDKNLAQAKEMMSHYKIGGLMVVNDSGQLVGILSTRDADVEDNNILIKDLMTPREKMIIGNKDTTPQEAKKLMHQGRVEKLPLVENDKVVGLIVMKDIKKLEEFPRATMDSKGRLMVGASIGVVNEYLERAEACIDKGADILVIDIAHGHSSHMGKAIKECRKMFPDTPIVAGDVATGEGVQYLAECGADAVRVGIGSGSICVTRLVAGSGVPQFTALQQCALAAREMGIPIIADGGIKPGNDELPGGADVPKAIGAGAHTVMLGSGLAGTIESPGTIEHREGKRVKVYRGMASMDAYMSKQVAEGKSDESANSYVPEGVTAVIPYTDEPVAKRINKLTGALRSGMSYTNAKSIDEFHRKVKFVRQTAGGRAESGAHIKNR